MTTQTTILKLWLGDISWKEQPVACLYDTKKDAQKDGWKNPVRVIIKINPVRTTKFTKEGYRKSTVKKILDAKRSKKIKVPSDEKGFMKWLHSKQ